MDILKEKIMTKKRFSTAVEELVAKQNMSYIDAMTYIITQRGMDYGNIKKLFTTINEYIDDGVDGFPKSIIIVLPFIGKSTSGWELGIFPLSDFLFLAPSIIALRSFFDKSEILIKFFIFNCNFRKLF